jgi:hypothetical protein
VRVFVVPCSFFVQAGAAETIFAKPRYRERYEMTKLIVDQIYLTLRQSQRNLTNVDIDTLLAFTGKNETLMHALTKTWENTALLGDLVLRLPDVVHQMVDGHEVRMQVADWGIGVCERSVVFEGVHGQQLKLVRQELGLIGEPDPNYQNPFSEVNIRSKKVRETVLLPRGRAHFPNALLGWVWYCALAPSNFSLSELCSALVRANSFPFLSPTNNHMKYPFNPDRFCWIASDVLHGVHRLWWAVVGWMIGLV